MIAGTENIKDGELLKASFLMISLMDSHYLLVIIVPFSTLYYYSYSFLRFPILIVYFVFFSNAPLKFQTYRKSKDWYNECPYLYHLDSVVVNILTYLL